MLHVLNRAQKFMFPIRKEELRKFLPMLALFFLISLVYNILRSMKIALVISAPQSGAEIIPYLKVWGILPGALLLTYIFTVLSRRLSREYVFYSMVSIFLSFFLIFACILYPFSSYLELSGLASYLSERLPKGAHGFVSMVRYWHFSLFYLFSELWGSVVLSMLFWGFVNEVTKMAEAERFYSVFSASGQLSCIAAGQLGLLFSFEKAKWDDSVHILLGLVLASGLGIIGLFFHLSRVFGPEVHEGAHTSEGATTKGKGRSQGFSLAESVYYVMHSRYLIYIVLMVVGYNLVFNLTDVLWTNQLGQRFHEDPGAINLYMSKMTTAKGIVSAISAVFLCGYVLRRFGWLAGALVTPLIIFVTSIIFLPLTLSSQSSTLEALTLALHSPVSLAVFIGAIQNTLTRASKYTFFDATKEMSFIPLSRSEQRKGKAVVDGISSRLGKSGGSLIYQCLLLLLTSISAATPYIIGIVFITLFLWIYAIFKLNKEMKPLRNPRHF
ncbi:MAG: NTP/NDP exchange transporter [Oligoflexales bacterium]|nr:NTP/NDP exchange transporter [Oligoflexales bacterium]